MGIASYAPSTALEAG